MCESTRVGSCVRSMILAIVKVLPDPVTPFRIWCFRSASTPAASRSIASPWSPAGWKGETTASGVTDDGRSTSFTVSVFSCPERTTLTSTTSPGLVCSRAPRRSEYDATFCPATSTMMSPPP